MHVLIVDDNPDGAELLACLMRARGAHAVTAGSVCEAMSVLALTRIDLVLTDYCMPGEDGLGLVRYCARAHPALPVVVVTGWTRSTVERDGAGTRCFDLIEKPVSDEDLDRVLAKMHGRGVTNAVTWSRDDVRSLQKTRPETTAMSCEA